MRLYKPNSWRRIFTFSALLFITTFTFIACKKVDSQLGANALDSADLLHSTQVDTFSLITYTAVSDSIITSKPAYSLLGSYRDPKFGSFNAGFYTQLRLSSLSPNFGDLSTITVDSLVLGLRYTGYYGNLNPQTVEVFQLTESISIDSSYYAFTTKSHSTTDLVESGYSTFTPNLSGKTVIGTDTVPKQLRIRLKNSLAMQLLTEANSSGTNFSSNENFLTYFKGMHVRVNNPTQATGDGGVFYFDIYDPLSKMTIYYTQGGVKKRFDFLINSSCANFNHVEVDNAGTNVQAVIDSPGLGQKEFYAQCMKTRAVIKMPTVTDLPKNAVIHKAQINLPIQYQTGSKYAPSPDLSASIMVNNKLSGIGVFGLYNSTTKQYTIDARNYMQALLTGKVTTDELIVSPRLYIISADRIVFNGPQSVNKNKPQLIITYTQF